MKKRILPLLLTAAMVAGLAGCGSSAAKETTAASDNNQTTAESTEAGSTTAHILRICLQNIHRHAKLQDHIRDHRLKSRILSKDNTQTLIFKDSLLLTRLAIPLVL